MIDITPSPPGQDTLKPLAHLIYGLYAFTLFMGFPAIIAIVLVYLKREDAAGTIYESHFEWQWKQFWRGLVMLGLCVLLKFIIIGFLLLAVLWFWWMFIVIKGWLRLYENRPIDHPDAWI